MSQQPSDREWDWEAGRRDPDDGIRHRLRHLFSHTGSPVESAIEELIAERSRELEARTEQLAATVADLQRREERARELRVAVEEMLRHGSAELDDRHAQLNELAAELTRREEAHATAERELAERRSELGAVELRRAALERREATTGEREAELERIAGELAEREQQLAAAPVAPTVETAPVEAEHLVFAAGDRYRLIEREGPAPRPGAAMDIEGEPFTVTRVGASPFPGDPRRCAYAEPAGE